MERFLSLVLLGMLLAQVLVLPGVLWIAGWLRPHSAADRFW